MKLRKSNKSPKTTEHFCMLFGWETIQDTFLLQPSASTPSIDLHCSFFNLDRLVSDQHLQSAPIEVKAFLPQTP